MNRQIYFFCGTTAELIKLAPIIKRFKEQKIPFKFITSGQTKIRFEDLEEYTGHIKIYHSFPEKENKSSIINFIFWFIKTLGQAIFLFRSEFLGLNKSNSYFIIHGDTVSSLIGALLARFYGLKIVHVESGLRSFNFLEPFPEEICRFIIIRLSDILFAPNDWAISNLKGLGGEKVNTGQNTVVESVFWVLSRKTRFKAIVGRKYYILTMHRQEHVLFRSKWTREMLEFVIKNSPLDLYCVLVMHHWTKKFLNSLNITDFQRKRLLVVERLPYIEFINLMRRCEYYVGDGCSNQEEAYVMGIPYIALRNLTERVEGLNKNVVISFEDTSRIKDFLVKYLKYRKSSLKPTASPSEIIIDYLVSNKK